MMLRTFTHADDIDATIEEKGVVVRVSGPDHNEIYSLYVGKDAKEPSGYYDNPTSAFVRVDKILDEAPGDGFGGFVVDVFDHEGDHPYRMEFLTRGALVALVPTGAVPSPEEVADIVGILGDMVVEVRNAAGDVLLDRSEAVKAEIGMERFDAILNSPTRQLFKAPRP
jgi:hypothetical protein